MYPASAVLVTLLVAVATAQQQVPTTIDSYPSAAALLRTVNFATSLTACGGSILNNRAVLTAARCFQSDGPERWRFRVGSTFWNSGGLVYQVSAIITHEDWDEWAAMTDIAIVHTATSIAFGAGIQPGVFGSYAVPVNDPVTILGWGYNNFPIWRPTLHENLRLVQQTTLDLDYCRPYYSSQGFGLRVNQFCTGFTTRDENTVALNQYFGEPGMPVFHGPNIVGIRSYTLGFNNQVHENMPSINTQFGGHLEWILANCTVLVLFLLGLVLVSAYPRISERIVGGAPTSIYQYPDVASLLFAWSISFRQTCSGVIINNRAVLTAAHCTFGDPPSRWRTRLGSAYANSGGIVFNTLRIISHPHFNSLKYENDLSIIRTTTEIPFGTTIRSATFAGPFYPLGDNEVVWIAGWGRIEEGGPFSEQLRHTQVWTINLDTCRQRYTSRGQLVTDNMFCSGFLDVGGRDACEGDAGGPVYHNRVVVGVASWGHGCGRGEYPRVNVRSQRYITWISMNA